MGVCNPKMITLTGRLEVRVLSREHNPLCTSQHQLPAGDQPTENPQIMLWVVSAMTGL